MGLNIIVFVSILSTITGYDSVPPRIAIIGGGIGGTSCAYFLKERFSGNASITLFERGVIGGRLSTLSIDKNEYEAGGAVIHPKNKYMSEFVTLLGLYHRKPYAGSFGLYNGEEFIFKESTWELATFIKLLWRYGWNILRLQNLLSLLLDRFDRIYTIQDQGVSFTTVSGLLQQMNPLFPNMTQEILSIYMKKEGFSDLFINELAQAAMLVNYGQTSNITAFTGTVSLAGTGAGLWSIKGGNKLVPEGLLKKSKAIMIHADVIEISLQPSSTFFVTYRENSNFDAVKTETFDVVIVATPFIKGLSNIKFTNFLKDFSMYEGIFHRLIVTLVNGNLNSSAFHTTSNLPDEILTNNISLIFNSIGKVWPVGEVEQESNVYKIFSQVPLTEKQLNMLFTEIRSVKVKDWMAYPHYSPPKALPPFMLHKGLYYVNAIEWAASAMEMSAVGAKNVALLAYNMWNQKNSFIDSVSKTYSDEL